MGGVFLPELGRSASSPGGFFSAGFYLSAAGSASAGETSPPAQHSKVFRRTVKKSENLRLAIGRGKRPEIVKIAE
jgi:hypothetical protein